jgi:hypothetical protein
MVTPSLAGPHSSALSPPPRRQPVRWLYVTPENNVAAEDADTPDAVEDPQLATIAIDHALSQLPALYRALIELLYAYRVSPGYNGPWRPTADDVARYLSDRFTKDAQSPPEPSGTGTESCSRIGTASASPTKSRPPAKFSACLLPNTTDSGGLPESSTSISRYTATEFTG